MRFEDWFSETVRHEPPRPQTRAERYRDARELFIAKMRGIHGPRAERIIVRCIGREEYERYGGTRAADHPPDRR